MKTNFLSIAVVVLALASVPWPSFAQSRSKVSRPAAAAKQTSGLLTTLPASDAVALIKVRRVFEEVLPSLFSTNAAKIAEIESRIADFKLRTGIDPRAFDEVALGVDFSHPSAGITRIDTVAIARGRFSTAALVDAGKAAVAGAYREEDHQGKKIYVFTVDQQLRVLGLWNLKIRELAVSPLDDKTLVLGDLERVRKTVATTKGAGRANAELISLASQDATAIISFGANLTPEVIQSLKIGNDAIVADLAAVRQVYGSIGASNKNLEMLLAARTTNPSSARNLSSTVETLSQIGALAIRQRSSNTATLARAALDNLKVNTRGNELQIRTAVAQADVAPLLGGF